MATTRSVLHKWGYLRTDSKLRGAIAFRMKDRNLDKEDIQEALGMLPYRVSNYLKGDLPNLNDYEIIKLGRFLGIEISLNVEFRDETLGVP